MILDMIDKIIKQLKEDMPIGTEVIVTGYKRSGLNNEKLKEYIPIGQKLIVMEHTNSVDGNEPFKPCTDCATYKKYKKCIRYKVIEPKTLSYQITWSCYVNVDVEEI